MDKTEEMIVAMLQAHHGPTAEIVTMRPREDGPQGYSGAALRYYDVAYTLPGRTEQMAIVTKEATLAERRTLAWLAKQGLPIPKNYSIDLTTDRPGSVCMEYAGDNALPQGAVREVARTLAAIHHAALGRGDNLTWLPRADQTFLTERAIDTCWRRPWQHLLTGEGYADWFARPVQSGEPDAHFAAAFADATASIEAVAAHFLQELTAICAKATVLTLIHTDLHNEHIRWQGHEPRIIDWEQARYGPLYLDLPNLFSREDALLYREALSERGQNIPPDQFLAGYDAARPYPGFKYFGIGLWNWRHGNPAQRHKNVQYWIDMVLGAGR